MRVLDLVLIRIIAGQEFNQTKTESEITEYRKCLDFTFERLFLKRNMMYLHKYIESYFRSILPNAYDGPYPRERRNPDFRVNYAPLTRGKMFALDMAKNYNQIMNKFYYSQL